MSLSFLIRAIEEQHTDYYYGENVKCGIAALTFPDRESELLAGRTSRDAHCIIIKQLYCPESCPCFPFVAAETWLMFISRLTGVPRFAENDERAGITVVSITLEKVSWSEAVRFD